VRSADIATRCREIALRVQCSGEWGELAETLTQAATEVERLRLRPEEMDALSWCRDVMPKMWEPPCAVVQIHSEVCGKMLKRLGGGE